MINPTEAWAGCASMPSGNKITGCRYEIATHHLLILLLAIAIVAVNPRGYVGGGLDDGRYLAAAMQWVNNGPTLGQNHWALRWPLILPVAALVDMFGPNRSLLMIPGILSWVGLALVNYWGVRRFLDGRSALFVGISIIATPGLAYWATLIYPDALEALLWSVALWSLLIASRSEDSRKQALWMAVAGLTTGIALGLRETALTLIILTAIFAWRQRTLKPRAWMIWLLAAAPLPLIEHSMLWSSSGDILYRLITDLHHIEIASDELRGNVATGENAPFNVSIMERYRGEGPVNLFWPADPYINLFANIHYGFSFIAFAVCGFAVIRKRESAISKHADLIRALLAVVICNFVVNTYVLALNPGPRMYVPATVAIIICTAVLMQNNWSGLLAKVMALLLAARIVTSLAVADVAPNYDIGTVTQRIAPAKAPLHVSWVVNSYLALAPAELRHRLHLSPAPIGGYQILVASRDDEQRLTPPSGWWKVVAIGHSGHNPWTVRLLAPPLHAAGFMKDFVYPDIQVRIVQRLPD